MQISLRCGRDSKGAAMYTRKCVQASPGRKFLVSGASAERT